MAGRTFALICCALTLRVSVAIFGWGEEDKDVKLFNLHCKFDETDDTELVCFVDVLDHKSKSASDYNNKHKSASFCGSWTVEHDGTRDVLSSHEPPTEVKCAASTPCRAINPQALVEAAFSRDKELCAAKGGKGKTSYTMRYETEGTDEIKITVNMLTDAGMISVRLGKAPVQEPEKRKPDDKKYYVSTSGGGFRALSSSIGVFRALSNANILPMVDMFASVSGGSWFLTKLTFDEKFAAEVLSTELPTAHVITKFYEHHYFPAMNSGDSTVEDDAIGEALSAISSGQTSLPAKDLGDMVGNFEHFGYNWRTLVEDFILGKEIFAKSLNTATVAQPMRNKIKDQTKFVFNWNLFNQWGDDKRQFFLRNKKEGKIARYPVYANAAYELNGEEFDVTVKTRGRPISELFDVCHLEGKGNHVCGDHDFSDLTVGQAAAASSAYPGFMTVQSWVKSLFTMVRAKVQSKLTVTGVQGYFSCGILRKFLANTVMSGHCNQDVQTELAKVIGCRTESLDKTASRWSSFMKNLGIDFSRKVNDSTETSKMAFDALNDVSGLGTIIAEHLSNDSPAQVLLIMNNGIGTNYVEEFFEGGPKNAGMYCEPGMSGDITHKAYEEIANIHEQSFKPFGADYKQNKAHPICAVPLAANTYFEGAAPQQHRFEDMYVPNHITYAYKKGAKIIQNDEFYTLKKGQDREIDLLFVILNAPGVGSLPNRADGSLGHVGVALGMEQAIHSLQKKFPSFFPDKTG